MHYTLRKNHAEITRQLWENIQLVGLMVENLPVVTRKLMFSGGTTSFQWDGRPLTKKTFLLVGQGGLRNRLDSNKKIKQLFKNEISPALAEIFAIAPDFSGRISLHFSEGTLQQLDLTTR